MCNLHHHILSNSHLPIPQLEQIENRHHVVNALKGRWYSESSSRLAIDILSIFRVNVIDSWFVCSPKLICKHSTFYGHAFEQCFDLKLYLLSIWNIKTNLPIELCCLQHNVTVMPWTLDIRYSFVFKGMSKCLKDKSENQALDSLIILCIVFCFAQSTSEVKMIQSFEILYFPIALVLMGSLEKSV